MLRRFSIGLGLAAGVAVFAVGLEPVANIHVSPTSYGVPGAAAYEIGQLGPDDYRIYRRAFELTRKGHWSRARKIASKASDPLLRKVLRWLAYAKTGGHRFTSVASFVDSNPDWPKLSAVQRRIEAVLGKNLPAADLLAWFRRHPPVTTKGAIKFAEALLASDAAAEGVRHLRAAWIDGTFGARNERAFLKRHRRRLTMADHRSRLDRLLWDGHARSARRMIRRVDKGWQALAMARLALRQSAPGVDWAVAQVPERLKDDPGLIYERLRWRRRKGKTQGALEMLETAPDRPPRPELWWNERAYLARVTLAKGDVAAAYRVARRHGQTSGVAFADGEWLAGWIALRFLGDSTAALAHFTRLYDSVSYPISRTRGAYWAGRAAEALGNLESAARWLGLAAAHRTTFYGQLAAARLGLNRDATLPVGPNISAPAMEAFYQRDLVRVVPLLAEIGEDDLVRTFVRHLDRIAKNPTERVLIARLAENANRVDLALWAARRASLAGVTLIDHGYPLVTLPEGHGPDPALIHAVIRQESGFDPEAVSPTGARGLMQLLPATARMVSRMLKTGYSKHRLTADPGYNVMLGRAHLAELIEAFDGSRLLALAAYNAGPRRVNRWLKTFGDPRPDTAGTADPIDWIESIPLAETRNYVQRVLEGLSIYRLRLGGPAPAVTLEDELR